MLVSAVSRGAGRRPALALVSILSLLAAEALAQDAPANAAALAPVLVTGSRFAADPAFSPADAIIIDSEQIRASGAADVNQAIRRIGGVYGRQNLYGTADYSLDLRGFGDTSDQNMVILIDGVRLSENEQAPALLSSIPIESVERIEIARGGNGVLYGSGATGGTIQIITRRAQRNQTRAAATAAIGSYGHQELRASLAKGWDNFALDANIGKARADNYRANNASDQSNFSGGLQWADREGRIGVRVDAARQQSRLAGPLSLAQFEADPRQTVKPNDHASYDLDRYTLFSERRFGAIELAAELAHSEKTSKMFEDYGGGFSNATELNTRGTQFSPRLRHLAAGAAWSNELVAGLDFADWKQNDAVSAASASQRSKAIYLQDEIRYRDNARIAFGVRHENFDQEAHDSGFGNSYRQSFGLNAWNLQGSYAPLPLLRLFARAGQSYRVANVDDNRYTRLPDQPLKPQTSHDTALGAVFGDAARKLTVTLFEHRLQNEIMFDPPTFTNVNLDATRRGGIELALHWKLDPQFTALANFQHVDATYADGPNAGREVTLVPRNTLTARLNWDSGRGQNADLGLQWVGEQRYGNDFDNACPARMPSYTTLDARYAQRFGQWELAIAGSNLTGRDYFSRAYGCRGNIYPDPGRQLKLTARYDF
ncbi:MAG: TonB-dependent receptor [Burkholderiaceae bacterium]